MLVQYQWNDERLRKIWENLYRDNPYLFPFSSWEYNKEVYSYKKIKPTTFLQKEYFLVYYNHDVPLMIMPLFIKEKTLYIFGENIGGPDNLDFIYDKNIRDEDIFSALRELREKFHGMKLMLYKVNERSRLYQFFKEYCNDKRLIDYRVNIELDRVCVKICYPDDYDTYFHGLSKNARSNIHKIYNKLKKQDISMELKVIHGPFKDNKLLSSLMKFYTARESERKNRKYDFFPFIKHRYFSSLTWAIQNMNEQYTFCLMLKDKPAAFMTGFATNFNEIVFPIVSMNSLFKQYSPGKVMINETIKYLQGDKSNMILDLSRGDERYKFEMGGSKHYNYRIFLEL